MSYKSLIVTCLVSGSLLGGVISHAEDEDKPIIKVTSINKKILSLDDKVDGLKNDLLNGDLSKESDISKFKDDVMSLADDLMKDQEKLSKKIEDEKKSLKKNKESLSALARSTQVNQPKSSFVSQLVSGESIGDIISNLTGQKDISDAQKDKVDAIDKQTKELEKMSKELEDSQSKLEELKAVSLVLDEEMSILKTEDAIKKEEDEKKARELEEQQLLSKQTVATTVESLSEDVVIEVVDDSTPVPTNKTGNSVVDEAMKYVGVPYVWGGKDPSGFDCSGFTSYVYRQATGKEIGGWTVPQESVGVRISTSEAVAGDLLFWGGSGGTYHVAISLGNGEYIHAPSPGQSVKVQNSDYFAPDFGVRVS